MCRCRHTRRRVHDVLASVRPLRTGGDFRSRGARGICPDTRHQSLPTRSRHRGRRLRVLVVEYYGGIPPAFILAQTPYSSWMKRQPPGIVANYPAPTDNPAALHRRRRELYFQQHYKHPSSPSSAAATGVRVRTGFELSTRYITDPNTPSMLKAEGVKYVLLHDDFYREAGDEPPPIPPGFRLVARIPGNVRALKIADASSRRTSSRCSSRTRLRSRPRRVWRRRRVARGARTGSKRTGTDRPAPPHQPDRHRRKPGSAAQAGARRRRGRWPASGTSEPR